LAVKECGVSAGESEQGGATQFFGRRLGASEARVAGIEEGEENDFVGHVES
jgi:hypothetical protein